MFVILQGGNGRQKQIMGFDCNNACFALPPSFLK
jgi:hypothetical protein